MFQEISCCERTCPQLMLFCTIMTSKNGCLKCQIKKFIAQKIKFFWGTKVLFQKVLLKINLNTKGFKEDYIEQKDLTL